MPNQTDTDVLFVLMYQSNVSFVISDIFTTFANLQDIFIHDSGLLRIQSNAVGNANQLIRLRIAENKEFTEIFANAFSGATNLQNLQLFDNAIEFIDSQAFSNLHQVTLINLNGNKLRQLHENVLSHLPKLQMASFNWNQIEVLPAGLFSNNDQLIQVGFMDNEINKIEKNILYPLDTERMNWVFFGGNLCVDTALNFRLMRIDEMNEILSKCFENFDNL